MYRVITADDEPFVLEGLELMIDWESHGFELAASANDGEKAFELIKELDPEVAILDIQMPGMTGIDIARKVKEEGIGCQIIILTAYADVEYARECLRFGIRHFAAKPIDPDELYEALDDCKKLLDRQRGGKLLLREKQRNEAPGIFEDKCVVAVMTKNVPGQPDISGCKILDHTEGMTAYYIGISEDNENKVNSFFNTLLENDSGAIGCYACGKDINECREKAVDSLMRLLHPKPGSLYKAAEHENNRISAADFGKYADKLNEGIAFRDAETVKSIIDGFFELLPDCAEPLQYAKTFYAYIVMRLNREFVNFDNPTDIMKQTGIKNPSEMHTISDYCNMSHMVCRMAIKRLADEKADDTDGIFDVIEKYIREHFREHIVIKDLAKLIYTSPGYLGTVFTKKTGVSIKEYIHSLRLEEAVRLMNSCDDKSISEVAHEVGYNNYNHFFLQFEKRFGMPPMEYKKLYRNT